MQVIDASALTKYLAKEEGWRRVSMLIVSKLTISIDLVIKEVANALWKKVRLNEMDIDTAKDLVNSIPKIIMIENQRPLLSKTLDIAFRYGVTVYDALYIALAENKGCSLITCDAKQAEVARDLNIDTIFV